MKKKKSVGVNLKQIYIILHRAWNLSGRIIQYRHAGTSGNLAQSRVQPLLYFILFMQVCNHIIKYFITFGQT